MNIVCFFLYSESVWKTFISILYCESIAVCAYVIKYDCTNADVSDVLIVTLM